MSSVLTYLLQFAAEFLTVGGRLVYWFPTVAEEYKDSDVPLHPALKLVFNCEQAFVGWSRRLITMEKVKAWNAADTAETGDGHHHGSHDDTYPSSSSSSSLSPSSENAKERLGHTNFREKYFAGFLRDPDRQEETNAHHSSVSSMTSTTVAAPSAAQNEP